VPLAVRCLMSHGNLRHLLDPFEDRLGRDG
jgi:hypothetical protein